MYKVIQKFLDGENGRPFTKENGGVVYEVGADYPVEGFTPSDEHIAYLLGCDFRGKGPVIAKVDTDEPPAEEASVEEAQEVTEGPADAVLEAEKKTPGKAKR